MCDLAHRHQPFSLGRPIWNRENNEVGGYLYWWIELPLKNSRKPLGIRLLKWCTNYSRCSRSNDAWKIFNSTLNPVRDTTEQKPTYLVIVGNRERKTLKLWVTYCRHFNDGYCSYISNRVQMLVAVCRSKSKFTKYKTTPPTRDYNPIEPCSLSAANPRQWNRCCLPLILSALLRKENLKITFWRYPDYRLK